MNDLYNIYWNKRPSDIAKYMLKNPSEEKYDIIIDVLNRRIRALGILLFVSHNSKACTLRVYNIKQSQIPYLETITISLKNPWVNILLICMIMDELPISLANYPYPAIDLCININEGFVENY